MLYSTAAYVSYKFEREIQIQSNDLNSLAASIQETKVYRDQGRTSGRALFLLACSSKISPIEIVVTPRERMLGPGSIGQQ